MAKLHLVARLARKSRHVLGLVLAPQAPRSASRCRSPSRRTRLPRAGTSARCAEARASRRSSAPPHLRASAPETSASTHSSSPFLSPPFLAARFIQARKSVIPSVARNLLFLAILTSNKTAGREHPARDDGRSPSELLDLSTQVGIEPTTSRVSGEVTLSYTTSNLFVAQTSVCALRRRNPQRKAKSVPVSPGREPPAGSRFAPDKPVGSAF